MLFLKLIVYFIVISHVIHIMNSPNVHIIYLSFIFLFLGDIVPEGKNYLKKGVHILGAIVILFLGTLVDQEWLFYVPIAVLTLYSVINVYSILIVIFVFPLLNLLLIVTSAFSVYIAYLIDKNEKLIQENYAIRDQLTSDNLKLTHQKNELMHMQEHTIEIASLNERNRIARELHDAIGHNLSSSILFIESLKYMDDVFTIKRALNDLQKRLETGMHDIRSSIHQLYSTSLNLHHRLNELTQHRPFHVELLYDIHYNLPYQLKLDLLSITKEALTNVQKHSNASKVVITFQETQTNIIINIVDNGELKSDYQYGMGLYAMKETIDKYQGIFSASSRAEGFHIYVSVKKEAL